MADKALALINTTVGLVYLFIIMVVLLLFFWQKRKRLRIKKWQKMLNLEEHQHIFQQLYQAIDGFMLSNRARQKQDAIEYTYGEIEFLPFIALLSLVKPDHGTVFYDLGSGIGKAVLACAMVYPVHKSVGVELLPELYLGACNQVKLLAVNPDYTAKTKKLSLFRVTFWKLI